MMGEYPVVYLSSHGQTAWDQTGRYNGMTDLPLSEEGESTARALKKRLHGFKFGKVFTSPLQRAFRTCELAGFGEPAEIDSDLREWDYGDYEGRTEAEIHGEHPGWSLFRDGCPRGESPEQVAARADRVISRLRSIGEDVLVFSSLHFVRALGVRWIGLGLTINARRFALNVGSVSIVGYEDNPARPVIRLWNDTRHLSHSPIHQRIAS